MDIVERKMRLKPEKEIENCNLLIPRSGLIIVEKTESTINPFPVGNKQQVRRAIYIRFNPYGVIVVM